jgi:zinc D-Ala-D-Ala carboxypeptidase
MTRRAFIKMTAVAFAAATVFPGDAQELLAVVFPDGGNSDEKATYQNPPVADERLKDYLSKVRNPDTFHPDDIILNDEAQQILEAVVQKLARLSQNVGSGHFSTLGFDEALAVARKQSAVGSFTKAERDFFEMIFSRDAGDYGFFGTKQVTALVQEIDEGGIIKIPQSGNYLYRGESLEKYNTIKKDLGEDVILTSGIRGIVKQFQLFLGKAHRHGGNLSLASRSLAPPGYSYHATGDFDIGQKGLGEGNFSELFTTTPVYKRLAEQGFVDYRYWRDNMLGVRYEPWHIKL